MSEQFEQPRSGPPSVPGNAPEEMGDENDLAFVADSTPKSPKGMFIVLGLVVVGAGLFLLLKGRGPASADAAAPKADTAKATVNQFLTDGPKSMQAMQDLLKNTEKYVEKFDDAPNSSQVPLTDLKTNPFRLAPPKVEPDQAAIEAAAQLEAQRKKVLAAVQGLKLQSIVYGQSSRACIISSEFYSEGQVVKGLLTIEKIMPDSVVVKGGQWKFEVKMNR